MYQFWYDYVKPKYDEKAKLCCLDAGCFFGYIKQMIFIKILQEMLKLELILKIMNQNTISITDYCLKEKIKKQLD